MKLEKNNYEFLLSNDNVSFRFSSNAPIEHCGDLCKLKITGEVPIPELLADDRLILPIDEGIAIEVGKEYDTSAYDMSNLGGHFSSSVGIMKMILIERNKQFLLITLKTPFFASYHAVFREGRYHLNILCKKENEISYGIYSSLAEACRAYKQIHNISTVTLAEKIEKNPEIQKLVGGGIFWVWNENYNEVMYAPYDTDKSADTGEDILLIADKLKKLGIDRAMFGLFFDRDSQYAEELYKTYGYLSTQYDNYNDVLNPELLEIIPNNRFNNCGYTQRRSTDYPNGVQILKGDVMAPAWELRGLDGKMHAQNTLCPSVAVQRMREEIPEILKKYPYYKGRFLDVFGQGISECYSKEHPMTLEECLSIKKGAYDFLTSLGLITGTEDCMEDLVDNLIYSEGLHSPVYFRIENAGRRHAELYDAEATESIQKKMLNPACRVPLWHLVYHDSIIAFPYWGDSTAACQEVLRQRILFACLFGCPPLYSFTATNFPMIEKAIAESYQKITRVHEKVALLPMTDYEVVTEDYQVQKTVFGERYEVIVNFSDSAYDYHGTQISAKDFLFREVEAF